MTYQLHHGNMLDILPMMERESIDAIVTDPPYGLGFMGKDWDHGVPGEHFWREAYRVSKPGAHLLAFGGTRTFHRLACAIEDAGWEIRDTVMWVYGQGFPKSHDVSKAIDREAGAEREVIGKSNRHNSFAPSQIYSSEYARIGVPDITSPATPAAAEWDGWGTALKPAWEPIIVARKPLQGTVAENVQRYGTGAMNIDGCRIETEPRNPGFSNRLARQNSVFGEDKRTRPLKDEYDTSQGRWPANLIHDGSAEVLAGFPMTTQNGYRMNPSFADSSDSITGWNHGMRGERGHNDTGSAARFFYCAKASKQDRDEGCEGLELRGGTFGQKRCAKCGHQAVNVSGTCQCDEPEWIEGDEITKVRNHHPTVKPTALMRYLCRLVTPPAGVILDPFMGSGSTGKAAILEGFNFVGVDTEIEYVEIAARRIEHACGKVGIVVDQPMMFDSKRETVDRPKQLILL